MIVYYLDPSAWVKRYCQEPGSEWVASLFAQNPSLACAALGVIEVTAALSRKAKAGEIDAAVCRDSLEIVSSDWAGFLALELTAELLERARQAARDRALRAADAIHLAAALALRRGLAEPGDQIALITSDHELRGAAVAEGIPVVDPVDAESADAAR
jgi:predicted nucleic acid-binding protein